MKIGTLFGSLALGGLAVLIGQMNASAVQSAMVRGELYGSCLNVA